MSFTASFELVVTVEVNIDADNIGEAMTKANDIKHSDLIKEKPIDWSGVKLVALLDQNTKHMQLSMEDIALEVKKANKAIVAKKGR